MDINDRDIQLTRSRLGLPRIRPGGGWQKEVAPPRPEDRPMPPQVNVSPVWTANQMRNLAAEMAVRLPRSGWAVQALYELANDVHAKGPTIVGGRLR